MHSKVQHDGHWPPNGCIKLQSYFSSL